MSSYLGRLVDRAVGPPAAGVAPRLAPVFPLRKATVPEPNQSNPIDAAARTSPPQPGAQKVPQGSDEAPPPSPARPEVVPPPVQGDDARGSEPGPEPVVRIETAAAPEPLRTEIRTHEPTLDRSVVRYDVEPPEPARAPARVTPRSPRDRAPTARRVPAQPQQPPRIEVRIGRVEVRQPLPPDPVEWPAPAAPPAATGFGELAASRRYVDRRWS